MTNLADFPKFNKDIMDAINSVYTYTDIYQIQGTNVYDLIFELREQDKKMQYSPYELFIHNETDEEAAANLFKSWDKVLKGC